MNKKSRMMIIALLLTGVAYSSAGAAELCQGELKHAVPVSAAHGNMVSVSLEQGQSLGKGAAQLSSKKPYSRNAAERYQKPILIDKGACHYKVGSFKQASIKM